MSKKLPIIIKERLYVPEDYLDIERVEKLYTKALFNDQKCESCEFMSERPNDMCEACDGYQGTYKLYVEKTKGNTTYYGLPLGNKKKILKLLPTIKCMPKRDLRPNNRIKHKIEFTGTLRDYQRECVDIMKAKKSGVLEAPPRSGKTVVFTALMCELRVKTLILASQHDWLEQFYETICGSKELNALTNIPDIEKFKGTKIVGICKTVEDYFNYDICLCFPANTDVLIDYDKSMTLKNIYESDHIQEVLAYDLEAKEIVRKKIVRKYKRKTTERLWEVNVVTPDGDTLPITCTWNHEFYTVNRGMVQAKFLRPTDRLVTYDGDFTRSFACICGHVSTSRAEHSGHTRMCSHKLDFSPYTCKCGVEIDSPQVEFAHSSWCGKTDTQIKTRMETQLHNPSIRRKIAKSLRAFYSNLTYEEKKARTSHLWGSHQGSVPSKPELIVISWGLKGLVYTGCDRKYRFELPEIMKNPDFVYPNRRNPTKVVEVMDFSYWHSKDEIKWIVDQYKTADIDCLVVDADEVKNNPDRTRGRIESFINNHYTRVSSVRELRNTRTLDVYTLEVEDVHNYFVVATQGNRRNHSNDASLSKLSSNATPILVGNSTYQTFISAKGQKRFNQIKNLFTLLGVDEVHRANSNLFSKVVNNLNCRYKFGLSGTPERKDGRDFIVSHIIGPTIAKPVVESCTPRVVVVKTGVDTGYSYKLWTYMLRFLERQIKRNNLIVKHAVNDLKLGHSIVIPVTFQSHVNTLVSMINKAVGKRVAVPFTGRMNKVERRQVILDARKGKVKVVVGMRQLIQLGINVPRWSAIYEVMPISNKPNHIQEVSRVLTPMEGKPQPLIKYFLDDMKPVKSCFRVCLFQTHTPLKHEISEETWKTIREYLSMKDPGDRYKPKYKPKIKAF